MIEEILQDYSTDSIRMQKLGDTYRVSIYPVDTRKEIYSFEGKNIDEILKRIIHYKETTK